jgi:4-amino-4-deoxy-L-arabinose transferase-like glycosyltransferase
MLLTQNLPLIAILIGVTLVATSIGPYHNPDTQLEYSAAQGVLTWGMPYANTEGNFINQPPLGFYLDALFLQTFGNVYNNGLVLMMAFGVANAALVYFIGKALYGKSTGLFAAALFGLTPWQVVMSRAFLIDGQCLFFSLSALLVGIYAIRRDSAKLMMVSGVFFAAAFMTKFFALFMLIPLGFYYLFHMKINLKHSILALAYFLPAFIAYTLWYQVIIGRGLLSGIAHDDFTNAVPSGLVPSPLFVSNTLIKGLGEYFLVAVAISVAVCVVNRKFFSKIFTVDLSFAVTILLLIGVNTVLAIQFNLAAPYIGVVKYEYQLLPLFCLLAASLIGKFLSLFDALKLKRKLNVALFAVASAGLIVAGTALILNINFVHTLSNWDYVLFPVESYNLPPGYSFANPLPIGKYGFPVMVQYAGFGLVLFGLAWASKERVAPVLKRVFRVIRSKCSYLVFILSNEKPPENTR